MRSIPVLLAPLLAASVIGQHAPEAPLREPGFGIVRTLDGSPWAGAEVHFLHRPHADVFDESVADRLVATTDERGRFRVDLLGNASYGVWARAPEADATGRVRITGRVIDATARTPVQLQEVEAVHDRRLRLDVDASWKDAPPLRVVVSSRGQPGEVTERRRLEPDDEGCYPLPLWWDAWQQVDVFSGGWLIRRLWLGPRLPESQDPDDTRDPRLWIRSVPRRWTRTVELVGPDGRTPVVGAVARLAPAPAGIEWPRSDARGRFEVAACDDPDMGKREIATYVVQADGYAERSFVTLHCSKDVVPSIQRQCMPGFMVLGALLLDGRPLAGIPIAIQAEVEQEVFRQWNQVPDRVVHTDDEGRFHIAGRSVAAGYRLVAVLDPARTAELASCIAERLAFAGKSPLGTPLSSVVILDTQPIAADGENRPRAVALDLAQLDCFELEFQTADREPAAAMPMLVAGIASGSASRMAERRMARIGVATRYWTDRRGRVGLVAHGAENLVAVLGIPGQGLGWARLPAAGTELTIPVERRNSLQIEVVDGNGRPVAGARAWHQFLTLGGGIPIPADATNEAALVVAALLRNQSFGSDRIPLGPDGRGHLLLPAGIPGTAHVDVSAPDQRRGRRQIEVRTAEDLADAWRILIDD